jgi:hypothetical protein
LRFGGSRWLKSLENLDTEAAESLMNTEGSTLRMYLESYEPGSGKHAEDTQDYLKDLIQMARELAGIEVRLARSEPDVVT